MDLVRSKGVPLCMIYSWFVFLEHSKCNKYNGGRIIPHNISLLLLTQSIFLLLCFVLCMITFSLMKRKEVNQSKKFHNFLLLSIVLKLIYGAFKILVVVVYYSNK